MPAGVGGGVGAVDGGGVSAGEGKGGWGDEGREEEEGQEGKEVEILHGERGKDCEEMEWMCLGKWRECWIRS